MSELLRISVAQLNFMVGDVAGNTQKILAAIWQARDEQKSDLVLFPELVLCGYPAEDLLLRADFAQAIQDAVQIIQQQVFNIDVILCYPQYTAQGVYNVASVIRERQIIAIYRKCYLPNYGVFDEARYFVNDNNPCIFTIKNIRCGIVICEDLWYPDPIAAAKQAGAQLILSPNASPFYGDKADLRLKVLQQRVAENHLPIVYANQINGQDDLIFDGGSLVIDEQGSVCAQADFFAEELFLIEIQTKPLLEVCKKTLPAPLSKAAKVYQALVLGVRDSVHKNNFSGALLGLSGGIDSALTLAIAVDALGKEQVTAVMLPSRYTSDLSIALAQEQIDNLGVQSHTISIELAFQAFMESLPYDRVLKGAKDTTEENLQARCRGTLLMAMSNKTGKILLNTSNKSELAVGYGTLYGDMAGGFAVLKDVPKTLVFELANYRNTLSPAIPVEVIRRPPTAELAPNQKDEDSLPPYAILDAILEAYVEQDKSLSEIIAMGFAEQTVQRVISMVEKNEYKRRQAPPGPRVTARAFYRERRYPMTSKFNK
jgi:NAD+ synthase (glutamine-hydrolysing)